MSEALAQPHCTEEEAERLLPGLQLSEKESNHTWFRTISLESNPETGVTQNKS